MRSALPLLVLALASCNSPDDRICAKPPRLHLGQDQQAAAIDCIHRWAYRLAKADGPNREIANAVIGGCAENIDALMESTKQDPAKARADFDSLALFYVVQARAGKCDVD